MLRLSLPYNKEEKYPTNPCTVAVSLACQLTTEEKEADFQFIIDFRKQKLQTTANCILITYNKAQKHRSCVIGFFVCNCAYITNLFLYRFLRLVSECEASLWGLRIRNVTSVITINNVRAWIDSW